MLVGFLSAVQNIRGGRASVEYLTDDGGASSRAALLLGIQTIEDCVPGHIGLSVNANRRQVFDFSLRFWCTLNLTSISLALHHRHTGFRSENPDRPLGSRLFPLANFD